MQQVSLLYKGEVLDHEAMAKARQDIHHFAVPKKGDAIRVHAPHHDIHQPTTMIVQRGPEDDDDRIVFYCPDGTYKQAPRGVGFIRVRDTQHGDVLPLAFIKTNARQALERLRARLDGGSRARIS